MFNGYGDQVASLYAGMDSEEVLTDECACAKPAVFVASPPSVRLAACFAR